MSIKQNGGVFGRNPTFNDVTIEGQLTFDGDIDINSDLKVDGDIETTGNVIIATSGKGIDFSATSGTGTSELFDDYEEGTWTPAFHGSGLTITYDQQVGKYVKIGNSIFFSLFLGTDAVSGESGSVALEISGLPYAMDESNKSSGVIGLSYGFGSSIAKATWISGGYSRIDLYAPGNTAATLKTDVLGTTTNDNRLYIAGQYFAA